MKKITAISVLFMFIFSSFVAQGQGNKNELNKNRLGLGFYPLSQKFSLKTKIIGNLYIENKYKLERNSINFLKLSYNVTYNDIKLSYVWLKRDASRIYSGAGIDFIITNFGDGFWYLDGYPEIVPIGVEMFPSHRLPNLGVVGEVNYVQAAGIYANFAIMYYLR